MFCPAKIVGLLGLVLLSEPALFAQAKKAPEVRHKITVRVLDGLTGFPEWFELPNIWVGSIKALATHASISTVKFSSI